VAYCTSELVSRRFCCNSDNEFATSSRCVTNLIEAGVVRRPAASLMSLQGILRLKKVAHTSSHAHHVKPCMPHAHWRAVQGPRHCACAARIAKVPEGAWGCAALRCIQRGNLFGSPRQNTAGQACQHRHVLAPCLAAQETRITSTSCNHTCHTCHTSQGISIIRRISP
jgi:hypothetical protein